MPEENPAMASMMEGTGVVGSWLVVLLIDLAMELLMRG